VALHPAFAAAELDRVRSSRLTQLMQQRENPTALAQRVFNQALYGKHPYGYTEVGTLPSLQGLTREDVIGFWQAGYQPGNAALVVAGDITETQLRALAEKHLGDWQGAVAAKTSLSVQQVEATKILLVDKPGAPQTALRIGQVAVARSSPDYVPLEVMNNTLGGLFSSRINLNLREKNGYTYGAGSAFGFRRGPGPFVVSTSVRTDVTAPAVREIYNELQAMRTQPVSGAELTLSKDSLARSLPGLFETLSSTVGSSSQLFVHGLPLDYYRRLPAAIGAVTAADVLRVARVHLQPETMVVVAVGDKAKIEQPLRQLELAPVETRPAP
jgi:zinc protease